MLRDGSLIKTCTNQETEMAKMENKAIHALSLLHSVNSGVYVIKLEVS